MTCAFLSRSLSASILAVLQYDPNSSEEWQTDHLSVVPAVVGRQAMREFVKRLCREHPDRLNQSAGLAELERLRPTRDVKRLIQIMTAPASTAVKEALSPARDALRAAGSGHFRMTPRSRWPGRQPGAWPAVASNMK